MNRIGLGILAGALVVALAQPAAAQEDFAALCPADSFFYVEADGGALIKGVPSLQLMKLAADPKVRDFIRPTLDKLRLDPDNPAASLLKMARIADYLPGRVAVAVRGMSVEIPLPNGTTESFTISPETPIDARLAYRLMGLYYAAEVNRQRVPEWKVSLDMVAAVEPGPALVKLGMQMLATEGLVVKKVRFGESEVTHVSLPEGPRGVVTALVPSEFYVHMGEKRWTIATTKLGMASALAGGPRASLANSPRVIAARKRMTAGHSILFAYADLEYLVGVFGKLVPPLLKDMNEINGLNSLQGLGLGVSITEGGIRESIGIILDGKPKGVWTVLDALPGGMRSLDFAPPGALASAGLKFDGALLFKRVREVVKEILPGAEEEFERELKRQLAHVGLDLYKDVLPGLGDEAAVFIFPPKLGPIPEIVVATDIRDEAAFGRLLAKAKEALAATGDAEIRDLDVTETIKGFQVFAALPMSPSFCVHRGHLFGASSPDLLRKVAENWGVEGAKSMRRDGRVFKTVLQGLNGGEASNLSALAYINARGILPIAMQFMPMVRDEIPEGWLDMTKIPNVARMAGHVNGVALGLRNDAHGLTLDTFSPVGFIVPMAVLGMAVDMERQRAREARAIAIQQVRRGASLGTRVLRSDGDGVTILGLFKDGPAMKAGLVNGDRIIAVGGAKIVTMEDLNKALEARRGGQKVRVDVVRGDATIGFDVELRSADR